MKNGNIDAFRSHYLRQVHEYNVMPRFLQREAQTLTTVNI